MAQAHQGLWFAGNRRTLILDRAGSLLPLCREGDVPKDATKVVHAAIAKANAHRFGMALKNLIIMTLAYTLLFTGGRMLFVPSSWSEVIFRTAVWAFLWLLGAVIAGFASKHLIDQAGCRALAECLRAGLCPSCCYDLSGTCPGPDTFAHCPECGGTWPGPGSPRSPV